MRQTENYWRDRASEVEQALLARMPENKLRPRLEPTRRAVELLGNPQQSYRVIHVTGTNGKTSTTRFIERILREHGLRTGRFTSPHLIAINERIAIDGEPVEDEALVLAWQELEPILKIVDDELAAEGEVGLTYFETLSVLAFTVFADAPIEVLALEVGMGGEWDSTNVADGDVAVFTPIAMDHAERLGRTLEEIATTKSGIIKPGARVIIGQQRPESQAVLLAKSGAIADASYSLGEHFEVLEVEKLGSAQRFTVRGLAGVYRDLVMPVLGDFQAENAAVAIAAVESFLGDAQVRISDDILRVAVADLSSPGRMQVVDRNPTVILDAAHNPAGAAVLGREIRSLFPSSKVHGVLAILEDKDVAGSLAEFETFLTDVVITQSSSPRAIAYDRLAEHAIATFGAERVEFEAGAEAALELAVAKARSEPDSVVLVTGSISLLADVLKFKSEKDEDDA